MTPTSVAIITTTVYCKLYYNKVTDDFQLGFITFLSHCQTSTPCLPQKALFERGNALVAGYSPFQGLPRIWHLCCFVHAIPKSSAASSHPLLHCLATLGCQLFSSSTKSFHHPWQHLCYHRCMFLAHCNYYLLMELCHISWKILPWHCHYYLWCDAFRKMLVIGDL